jgi:hypothetical protein
MSVERLRNRYEGERVFVLGNGPSLERTPLDRLEDEYTFAVNSIANIFDRTDWRPSFYTVIHPPPDVSRRNVRRVVDLDVPCFLPRGTHRYASGSNVHRLDFEHIRERNRTGVDDLTIDWDVIDIDDVWSRDISELVCHYTTVLYPTFQIARYLGFSEMYLLGCDLYPESNLHIVFEKGDDPAVHSAEGDSTLRRRMNFLRSADRPLRTTVNGLAYLALQSRAFSRLQPLLVKLSDRFADSAHFYDVHEPGQYLGGNQVRNERIVRSHRLARRISTELGFSIFNATLGGSLEVHPRVDLRAVLESDR